MERKMFADSFMCVEARKSRQKLNLPLMILVFAVVFLVGTFLQVVIPVVSYFIIRVLRFGSASLPTSVVTDPSAGSILDIAGDSPVLMSPSFMVLSLFGTVFTTLVTILYCRFIEKRSMASMGFVRKSAVKNYLSGYLLGVGMIALSVLFCVLAGAISFDEITTPVPVGLLLLFFFGFLVQGMSEEVLLRSYLMMSLQNKIPIFAAVVINSVLFAALHLGNPGITALSLMNLILFGVFASIFTLVTDNIWGICALHSAWNFAQGNLFGIEVSGMDTFATVFSLKPVQGKSLLHGGSFGLEGGLVVAILLILAIAVLLFIEKRKSRKSMDLATGKQPL